MVFDFFMDLCGQKDRAGDSEPLDSGAISGGIYVLRVSQFGTVSFTGKTLIFKIGDVTANQTETCESRGATELNLTASK